MAGNHAPNLPEPLNKWIVQDPLDAADVCRLSPPKKHFCQDPSCHKNMKQITKYRELLHTLSLGLQGRPCFYNSAMSRGNADTTLETKSKKKIDKLF